MPHHERFVRIGEAARLTGMCINTIRNLERRGLITVARDWSGDRRFSEKDVAALCALVAQPPALRRKARRA